jgi:hypothetical protein
MKIRLIGLILVILLGIIVLTGCNIIVTAPDCCTVQDCTLTITAGYWVWGWVYINGQNTGVYIDFDTIPSVTISSVPCNQTVEVKIVDTCEESHKEYLYITAGINYLPFNYWKNEDKSIDFHQR